MPVDRSKILRPLTAALITLAVLANSAFAAPKAIPVQVTNDTTSPVPVNGNVVVSGTANVNVTNPVTIANPVSSVTIGNTMPIPVSVTGTIPVPVIENPARTATSFHVMVGINANTMGGFIYVTNPGDIPVGERFVVELASVGCEATPGSFPTRVRIEIGKHGAGPSQMYFIPMQYQGTSVYDDINVGNLNGGFHIDSAEDAVFYVDRGTLNGATSCSLTLSGHFVTL
jgi:hypothetical protein